MRVVMHEPASGKLRAQTPPRATRSLRAALITAPADDYPDAKKLSDEIKESRRRKEG